MAEVMMYSMHVCVLIKAWLFMPGQEHNQVHFNTVKE